MSTSFDYAKAKAYLRSGSRSDLFAESVPRPKIRIWLCLVLPLLGLCLIATLVLSRTLASEQQADARMHAPEKVFVGLSPSLDEDGSGLMDAVVEDCADFTSAADDQPVDTTPRIATRDIAVSRGDTLLELLVREGVGRSEAYAAVAALQDVFNPRRLRNEHALTMLYEEPEEDAFAFKGLTIRLNALQAVQVDRCAENGFAASEIMHEYDMRTVRAEFKITSSLYESAVGNGIPFEALLPPIRAYAYDVDFQRDIHPGDFFEIMYDLKVDNSGEVIAIGSTPHAVLTTQGRRLPLYRYRDSDGELDYYDQNGRSLRKSLMVTPIHGARLSSGYGNRRHPILGYSRMHRGLDFAAPTGTPVMAAGDGVVEAASHQGNYGNMVRLRHPNNYHTLYAHLSRFGRGIRPGVRVKQGQVIGYVGSTGMSTGPHLHYEVHHHGRHINPASIKSEPGRILDGSELARFMETRAELDARFASLQEPVVVAGMQSPDA